MSWVFENVVIIITTMVMDGLMTLVKGIDVQYWQSESDGESHRTSFTMDPIEFF